MMQNSCRQLKNVAWKLSNLQIITATTSLLWQPAGGAFIQLRNKSALTAVITKQINQNFELRTLDPVDTDVNRKKPLVILYAWLAAKKSHTKKYADFYLGRGFDVLNVCIEPMQLLRPKRARLIIHQIINYVREDRLKDQPILTHGFSVGGYLYGELLIKLTSDPDRHRDIIARLIGQIFDSPVDFDGIPDGISKAITTNRILRRVLRESLAFYKSTFTNQMIPYIESARTFKENRLAIPSLMLFSRADPISDAEEIASVADQWRRRGIDVYTRCWLNSPHVSHMRYNYDEYVRILDDFLSSIGVQAETPSDEVIKQKARPIEIKQHVADRIKQ
ncbi:transmembrane protein 53-like [Tubulanus polymorphus]|uniref:transmembrane protein 53-like n=1 Tax=Tubulanus polymorphus TaxID=672921 RepID=UPI003DA609E5